MTALRGVNLGGWLVLERWITPSLFAGSDAQDEYSLYQFANAEQRLKLAQHRKTFITAKDFEWLADNGVQAVRLPVGYWLLGDAAPYETTLPYVDAAFVWAKKYGVQILLCLHGAPGSQNGNDHSGRIGPIQWTDPDNVRRTLKVIDCLAGRYAGHPSLLGIELLNEPSATISTCQLVQYYHQAYRHIRAVCGRDTWVVYDDCFQLRRWQWVLHWPRYRNAYLDSHQYQVFSDEDKALDVAGHIRKTRAIGRSLKRVAWHRKVLVGEWSAALDPKSLHGLPQADWPQAYKRYCSAQLAAYDTADAWFYWTYRTETMPEWNFRRLVEHGWI